MPLPALLTIVCDLITRVAKVFLGTLVGAIVAITLAAVWWRYVLNAPLAWPEQVSRIMFVWITFVGAAVLYRERLHVATVIFDRRVWTARRSVEGWRDYRHPSGDTENPVLMHEDHVHVDVLEGG